MGGCYFSSSLEASFLRHIQCDREVSLLIFCSWLLWGPHTCCYLRAAGKRAGWGRTWLLISDQRHIWEWWDQEMNFSFSGWWWKWGLLRWWRHRGREWQWRWEEWRSWWRFSQSADQCSSSRECSGMFRVPTLIQIPGGVGWWKIIKTPHSVWAYWW